MTYSQSIWAPVLKFRSGNTDQENFSYPVGGVRIEDDILVTKEGHENLTTAPKGDDALKIINGDDETSMPDGGESFWKWL